MHVINLTPSELYIAAQAGAIRRITSLKEGHNHFKHQPEDKGHPWDWDIEGAAAEMALAKFLGLYWGADNRSFKLPDVHNIQVRSTTRPDGCMIVRKNDDPRYRYVLIVGREGEYRLAGWRSGKWCKSQPKHYRNGCWWIPQDELISMGEFSV